MSKSLFEEFPAVGLEGVVREVEVEVTCVLMR
jgi:hypothetical protein